MPVSTWTYRLHWLQRPVRKTWQEQITGHRGRLFFSAAILALIITAVDTYFSSRMGLLAYPPYYDGISYVIDAKSSFYRLSHASVDPHSIIQTFHTFSFPLAPLWEMLILLNLLIFGAGEWQAYTVRVCGKATPSAPRPQPASRIILPLN